MLKVRQGDSRPLRLYLFRGWEPVNLLATFGATVKITVSAYLGRVNSSGVRTDLKTELASDVGPNVVNFYANNGGDPLIPLPAGHYGLITTITGANITGDGTISGGGIPGSLTTNLTGVSSHFTSQLWKGLRIVLDPTGVNKTVVIHSVTNDTLCSCEGSIPLIPYGSQYKILYGEIEMIWPAVGMLDLLVGEAPA